MSPHHFLEQKSEKIRWTTGVVANALTVSCRPSCFHSEKLLPASVDRSEPPQATKRTANIPQVSSLRREAHSPAPPPLPWAWRPRSDRNSGGARQGGVLALSPREPFREQQVDFEGIERALGMTRSLVDHGQPMLDCNYRANRFIVPSQCTLYMCNLSRP